ncbi:MAG TPA: phosphatase PAP2 family protein [Polyangiaceae bacterium]|nr:phosphatase PAP2 family protein [Polyangiaceae bacterium]
MRTLPLLVALVLTPVVCRAEGPARPAGPKTSASSLWHESMPTFSWPEGVATVSAGVLTAVLALRPPPQEARWRSGILFDTAVRQRLRLESASDRHLARRVGDVTYYAAPLLPLIIDPLVASLAARGDRRAALNLELVGLEAFSYAGLLSFVSTRISVRERPDTTECLRQHPDGAGCEFDTEAFWSGHTSIAAASAGLVCASHQYMPLWGSPAADVSACALAATGALVTGVTRLAADRHYATDVIMGLGVGFGFGYGVPVLLHYARRKPGVTVTLAPSTAGSGATFNVAGLF